MAHHSLSPSASPITQIELQLASVPESPQAVATLLAEEFGMRGKLLEVAADTPKSMGVVIARPGTRYQLSVDRTTGRVTGEVKRVNAPGFLKALHITAGIKDRQLPELLWGVAALTIAICLIGLIVTGFLLWYRRSDARRAGTIFLTMSLVYALGTLIVIRLG